MAFIWNRKSKLEKIMAQLEAGPDYRQSSRIALELSFDPLTSLPVFSITFGPPKFSSDLKFVRLTKSSIRLDYLVEKLMSYTLQGGVDEGFELYKQLNTLLAGHRGWQYCTEFLGNFFEETRQKYADRLRHELETNTQEDIAAEVIRRVAPQVEYRSHWFSVWRVLHDAGFVVAATFSTFVETLATLLPDREDLPSLRNLQEMDCGSFHRPLSAWSENNAPVKGARYRRYHDIAEATERLLRELSPDLQNF